MHIKYLPVHSSIFDWNNPVIRKCKYSNKKSKIVCKKSQQKFMLNGQIIQHFEYALIKLPYARYLGPIWMNIYFVIILMIKPPTFFHPISWINKYYTVYTRLFNSCLFIWRNLRNWHVFCYQKDSSFFVWFSRLFMLFS